MRKIKLISICIVILALTFIACKQKDDKHTLVVYNWGDYIDPSLIEKFEQEEGVDVIYNEYSTNEDLFVKLKNSTEQIDIVIPSDYMLERLIKKDLIQKINTKNIPNYKNINPIFKARDCDPTGEYGVPYLWQTVGLIYNSEKYPEGLHRWEDLWNEKYKKDMVLYNAQRDVLTVALKKLGYSVNTRDINELKEAEDELLKQKEINYAYLGDEIKDVLVNEDANIGVVYSGDAGIIMSQNPKFKFVIPEEGSNMAVDYMAIPNNAKHIALAEKFINFMLREDVAVQNTEYIMYNTPMDNVKKKISKQILDFNLYPTEEEIKRLSSYRDMSDLNKLYDEIWTEITSGL